MFTERKTGNVCLSRENDDLLEKMMIFFLNEMSAPLSLSPNN